MSIEKSNDSSSGKLVSTQIPAAPGHDSKFFVNPSDSNFQSEISFPESETVDAQIAFNAEFDRNDYPLIQQGILDCALRGGGVFLFPVSLNGVAVLLNPVIVPSYVTVDLNGCHVAGGGIGIDYVFVSGYLENGNLYSNIDAPVRSHSVLNMSITNGLILNCKGIRVQDCLDSCQFERLGFTNCSEGLNEKECFYSNVRGIVVRGGDENVALPGVNFDTNVNAQLFDGVSVVERNYGAVFSGGVNAASLRSFNVESAIKGIILKDQISAMNIDSSYLENISGIAIDATDAVAKENLTINNGYFNGCAVAISGVQMRSGVTIGRGNHYVNTAVKVRMNDMVSAATVELLDTTDPDNCLPRVPEGYDLGPRINVVGRNLIYSSTTGLPVGCNQVTTGIVPLFYAGKSGFSPNRVMFAEVGSSATTGFGFNINIDTRIVFDPYVFMEFSYTVRDNEGVFEYWGEARGSAIHMKLKPENKTVAVENVDGYVRFVLGEHHHPEGKYVVEGVQRIK